MNIYEQIEWHGMAERGAGRRDPMTSVVEFNTQPGRESFQKVPARKDYLDGRIAVPSIRISNIGSFFMLKHGPATASFANVSALTMNVKYLSFSSASLFHCCACFKHDDYSSLDANQQPIVFGAGDYGYSGIRLSKTSGSWRAQFQKIDTSPSIYAGHTFTADLLSGSWYWVDGIVDDLTGQAALYKDGGTSPIESATFAFVHNMALSETFYVGGSDVLEKTFWGGEVAYGAINVTAKTTFPTAWEAAPGGENFYAFYLHNPRYTFQPAQVLETPGSKQVIWAEMPPPFWEETGVGTPMAAVGFENYPGKNIIFDSSGIELFRDLTVFMFYTKGLGYDYDLIRNEDSSFRVWSGTSNKRITVVWTPADPSVGTQEYGRQTITDSTADVVGYNTAQWFAVEVDPTNEASAGNVGIYQCDIHGTGLTWTSILASGTTIVGNGIDCTMLSDMWYLMDSRSRHEVGLLDFRVVVGDAGWKTAQNVDALKDTLTPGIVAWMNNATNYGYVNERNVRLLHADNFADVENWPMACADRVDGLFRYYLNPYHSRVGRGGCSHIVRGPMPYVEDMLVDSKGELSFTTDAYYYDAGKVRPQFATRCPNRSLIAPMGTHRYIVNNAPLQLIRNHERQVGVPPLYVESKGPTASNGTEDFRGSLLWGTYYQYALTLYDPLTGDEGAPMGPFRFVTESTPTSTTVDYGTPGCAFIATAVVHFDKNAVDLKVKAYRYATAVGAYYYETTCPIGPGTYNSASSTWQSGIKIPFRLDDELLLLGAEVNTENRMPPEHSVSTIYDGRGFYVDALRQSRIYFSRRFKVGTVPKTNFIWTDEGAGGAILGFLESPDGLILLRERSIWIIPPFATDDAAWAYPLHPTIGCVSGSCAVWAGGLLWWASPLGLHSWDGQGQPQNHTQRISGYDKQVWDHAPRRTIAYYDSQEFKVVLGCDGAGLSVDVRTGAVALISAPERSFIELQAEGYSGPLYGHLGGIFQRADGNKSLTLSASAASCGNAQTIGTTGSYTQLSWFWAEAGKSATHIVGVLGNATAFQAGVDYLSVTSDIGRAFTSIDDDYTELFSVTIADAVDVGSTASGVLLRSEQSLLDKCGIDALPFYYKSQPAYLGRSERNHFFERLTFYTDDSATTAAGAAAVSFSSWVPGQATVMTVTAPTAVINANDVHELHTLQRGNRFQYEILELGTADFPNIIEVGVHLNTTRERGRRQ